ncbi:HDOD domain-containing protein [Marinobacter sp. X15-166B]|uniref:HDOD domain-containing protein n=1 Tax=Marinobacter sp. X15-166B TaxID=1897620 RepID=UPI00085C8D29|nr:HDOD domain-containing protein [Marinobacter sp. X15-166B]OEY65494.1 hypothetical protein BG841_02820 [Marinobacter sp. X15-166B]
MAGFLSWVSRPFRSRSPAPGPAAVQVSPQPPAQQGAQPDAGNPDDYDKLDRHLYCWLLDTTPSHLEKTSPHTAAIVATLRQNIRDGKLDELPRQPLTLPRVLRALSDPNGDRNELASIILDDPALTDQLLQIANSPFFRPGEQEIESVDQAIFVLGLNGIRNVVSAAVMRPMLSARYSREAVFSQRVWRWGLTCARAAELIAREQHQDTSAAFMVGLLPALACLTLHREVHRLMTRYTEDRKATPAMVRAVLETLMWPLTQQLAIEWNLPVRYRSLLEAAMVARATQTHTPLADGLVLGSREVLRHAHQRNLPEENLVALLALDQPGFARVREALSLTLKRGG